ncbi:MAG: tRNA epoxyqueuosine(34) reductase QueG [Planctomycetaceae bacterium]|nr:tRNA epoxyqueuosine(34) reductase QueG [Planctomycetaceae bacterium]
MPERMSDDQLSAAIREQATSLDFDLVRIAPAVSPTGFHPLLKWLDNGYAADMDWMDRRREAYRHPDGVMPGTHSVIVVALNYSNESPDPTAEFRISRYAWGTSDYHTIIRKRLKSLCRFLREQRPEAHSRAVVDTAPLLERDFARIAGIGWFGKNTMLISREIGSWFFLGAVLTELTLDYDTSFEEDYCGTCTACLDACPTDAFPEPGVLDANRCISYLTIERTDKPISATLRSGMQDWIFGCDICQEVCPWNRFAPPDSLPEFHPRPDLRTTRLLDLLTLGEAEFEDLFAGTPLFRTGREAIVRNAAIVAGNQQASECRAALQRLTEDASPLIREAASQALQQM